METKIDLVASIHNMISRINELSIEGKEERLEELIKSWSLQLNVLLGLTRPQKECNKETNNFNTEEIAKQIAAAFKPLFNNDDYLNSMDKCMPTSIKNGNSVVVNNTGTFIITINSNNVKKSKIVAPKSEKKTLRTFYKFVYETRPRWYKEDEYVEMETIAGAYRKYFSKYDVHTSVISEQLKGEMFTTSIKSGGSTRKKLLKFEKLRDHF